MLHLANVTTRPVGMAAQRLTTRRDPARVPGGGR